MSLDTTLTREEALARGKLGEMRLREHAAPGPSAYPRGTDPALYLGSSDEARAACRLALATRPNVPGIILLNGLLLAEEGSFADGEKLMLEWLSSVEREDRHFYLACFYYYSERPEKVAAALRDTLAQGKVPFTCRPDVLALVRYLYESGDFESVLEICQSQLRPAPGYEIAADCYDPYYELLSAATASRNGPEVHELPAWPVLWQPVDPFSAGCSNQQLGSPRDSILYVEHVLGRPIDLLGQPSDKSLSRRSRM
jgi:tetratricopeptide (TPR) repeat protein